MEKNANFCIFGPILCFFLDILGNANEPRIVQIKNFKAIFHTKSKLKWGLFMKKIAVMIICGLILQAVLKNMVSAN